MGQDSKFVDMVVKAVEECGIENVEKQHSRYEVFLLGDVPYGTMSLLVKILPNSKYEIELKVYNDLGDLVYDDGEVNVDSKDVEESIKVLLKDSPEMEESEKYVKWPRG
jgi:hypothetical protein